MLCRATQLCCGKVSYMQAKKNLSEFLKTIEGFFKNNNLETFRLLQNWLHYKEDNGKKKSERNKKYYDKVKKCDRNQENREKLKQKRKSDPYVTI